MTDYNYSDSDTEFDTDIDYEHLDDLPIFDHIESKYFMPEQAKPLFNDDDSNEWIAA